MRHRRTRTRLTPRTNNLDAAEQSAAGDYNYTDSLYNYTDSSYTDRLYLPELYNSPSEDILARNGHGFAATRRRLSWGLGHSDGV
jgi:hypothetical protein